MSKAKLNTKRVLSELTGKSKFFEQPSKTEINKSADNVSIPPAIEKPKKENSRKHLDVPHPLGLSENQITLLRQSTHKQFTYRLTAEEIEWMIDNVYTLNKKINGRIVNKNDVIRVGLMLFSQAMNKNDQDILDLFQQIK